LAESPFANLNYSFAAAPFLTTFFPPLLPASSPVSASSFI